MNMSVYKLLTNSYSTYLTRAWFSVLLELAYQSHHPIVDAFHGGSIVHNVFGDLLSTENSDVSISDDDDPQKSTATAPPLRKKVMPRLSRITKMNSFNKITGDVVLQYWKQAVKDTKEVGVYKRTPSRGQIKKYVEEVLRVSNSLHI